MRLVACVVALLLAVPTSARAQAEDLDPRVLVLPVEGSPPHGLRGLGAEVADALARGAARMTPTVARATASLDDTAVIVGCDPSEPECLDAVAAALNVDQILLATIATHGEDASVEVTAVTREADPVRRTFTIRPRSRQEDLADLEAATPELLEAGEARKGAPKLVEVVKPPPDPDPAPAPVPAPEGRRSLAPVAVLGGGGALVVAGAIFWGLAGSTQTQIDDAPAQSAADLERLADLEDEARRHALIGNVLVIGGVVAAAAGVTWYLLDRRRDREVRVAPLVAPGGGGLAIGGAW